MALVENAIQNFKANLEDLSLDFQNDIKLGNIQAVKLSISRGIDINQPLPNGEIPLHLAICLEKQEIVLALLELGADPNIIDFHYLTAYDHALLIKNEQILACLVGEKIGKELTEIQALFIGLGESGPLSIKFYR